MDKNNTTSSHLSKIIFTTLTLLFLTGFSAATSISKNDAASQTVAPGATDVPILDFTVQDGGDLAIANSPSAGDTLTDFDSSDNVYFYDHPLHTGWSNSDNDALWIDNDDYGTYEQKGRSISSSTKDSFTIVDGTNDQLKVTDNGETEDNAGPVSIIDDAEATDGTTYSGSELATEVEAALNTEGSETFTVQYQEGSDSFEISTSGGVGGNTTIYPADSASLLATLGHTSSKALEKTYFESSDNPRSSRFVISDGVNEQLTFSPDGGTTYYNVDVIGNDDTSISADTPVDGSTVATAIENAMNQPQSTETYTVSYSSGTFTISDGGDGSDTVLDWDGSESEGPTTLDKVVNGVSTNSDETITDSSSVSSDNTVDFNVVDGVNDQIVFYEDGGSNTLTTDILDDSTTPRNNGVAVSEASFASDVQSALSNVGSEDYGVSHYSSEFTIDSLGGVAGETVILWSDSGSTASDTLGFTSDDTLVELSTASSNNNVAFNVISGINDDITVSVDGGSSSEYTINRGVYDGPGLASEIESKVGSDTVTVDYGSTNSDSFTIKSDTEGLSSSVSVTSGTDDLTTDIGFGSPTERTGDALIAAANAAPTSESTTGTELTGSAPLKYVDGSGSNDGSLDTGEPVATDEDSNGVFQDQFTEISVNNSLDEELSASQIDAITLRQSGSDVKSVTTVDSLPKSISGFTEDIKKDTDYTVTVDVASGLSDTYDIQAETTSLTTESGDGSIFTNANTQTVDGTPPSVTVNQPSGDEDLKEGDTFDITWSATDTDSSIASNSIDIDYTTDGSNWNNIATGEGNDGTYQWTVPNLDSTSVQVRVSADDTNGNTGSDTSSQFDVDSTPPTASLTSPTGVVSSIPQDTIKVSLLDATTDVDENSIAVTLNDGSDLISSAGTGDSAVSYDNSNEEVNIHTSGLSVSDGTVTVEVDADDTAGNSLTSHSDTFTLDTTAPTISEMNLVDLTDGNGAVNGDDTLRVNATVTDVDSGVVSVTADMSDFSAGDVTLESETTANTDWDGDGDSNDANVYGQDVSTSSSSEGTGKSATITATDGAGNQETTASVGSITVDRSDSQNFETSGNEVVVKEDQNSNGILNEGDKFSVRINANDTLSGIQTVEVDLSSVGLGTVDMTKYEDTSVYNTSEQTVGSSYDVDPFHPGVTLTDEAGNTYSINAQGDLNLDSQAPDGIQISSINPRANGEIDIEVTSLPSDTSYYLVYRDSSQIANVSAGQTEYIDDQTTHGTTYSYTVAGVDDAGNFGDNTSSVNQEADSKAPTVSGNVVYQTSSQPSITGAYSLTEQGISSVSTDTRASLVSADGTVILNDTVSGTGNELQLNSGDLDIDVSATSESLSEGTATVRVWPEDELGNKGSEFSDTFKVDTVSPSVESVETLDADTNGNIDTYRVNYSEEVQNVDGNDIGASVSGVSQDGANVNYTLQSETSGTAATPDVSFTTSEVQDLAGNNLATGSKQAVDSANPLIDLDEGLNLVSFPISSTEALTVSDVLDESKTNKVWKYTDDGWKAWTSEKAGSSGFSFDVRAGEGYIVNSTTDYTSTPEVDELTSNAPRQIDLVEGWNLVGHYDETAQQIFNSGDGTLATVASSNVNQVWKNSGTGSISYSSTDTSADNFQPGIGYWVQTRGDLSDGTVTYGVN